MIESVSLVQVIVKKDQAKHSLLKPSQDQAMADLTDDIRQLVNHKALYT